MEAARSVPADIHLPAVSRAVSASGATEVFIKGRKPHMNTQRPARSTSLKLWLGGLSIACSLAVGAVLFVPWTAAAQDLPSGEVEFRQSSIEPAYNDLNGKITYFLTPARAHEKANGHAVAPIYIIVYPTSAAGSVGTLNCMYQPTDNCPSHGQGVAYMANLVEYSVYSGGVLGHDHILAAPPSPPVVGGDFNIAWLPVFVFFTSSTAANTHIKTLDQLNKELADGNVIEKLFPNGTFHCSIVPATVYNMGTPASATQ